MGDLNASEGRIPFHHLVEACPDALFALSLQGKILSWNEGARSIFFRHTAETVGCSLAELLMDDEERAAVLKALAEAVSFNFSKVEAAHSGRDTELKLLEWSLTRRFEEGKDWIIACVKDFTRLKANRLEGDFLANMSHELRTPLNAIIGFAELMFKGKVGPLSAEHHEYIGDILTSSRQMLQLVNDVLDFAKVDSGEMEFTVEVVNVSRLVSEVRDELRELAAAKHIEVEMIIEELPALIALDPGRIKQVLYNYVFNAIKCTPELGSVTVRVLPEGAEMVRFDVKGSGIGIATEDLDRLLVGSQQDAESSMKYQGKGFGLALTKRIVEMHGGWVEVRSVVNHCSRFSAVLPRVPRPGHPLVASEALRSNGG